jgi:hypothetical protein
MTNSSRKLVKDMARCVAVPNDNFNVYLTPGERIDYQLWYDQRGPRRSIYHIEEEAKTQYKSIQDA